MKGSLWLGGPASSRRDMTRTDNFSNHDHVVAEVNCPSELSADVGGMRAASRKEQSMTTGTVRP